MVHWHCMGLGMGTGLEPGLGTVDLYIMPLTVHTTQAQRRGTGLGTNKLHTHCPVPFPILNLSPVQYEWAIRTVNILSQISLPLD